MHVWHARRAWRILSPRLEHVQRQCSFGAVGEACPSASKEEGLDPNRYGRQLGHESRPHLRYRVRQARSWNNYATTDRTRPGYHHGESSQGTLAIASPTLFERIEIGQRTDGIRSVQPPQARCWYRNHHANKAHSLLLSAPPGATRRTRQSQTLVRFSRE